MKEQAKFTCSPLGKSLEKQTKPIEDQGKKEIKTIYGHGKKLMEANELVKKDFNIDRNIRHDQKKNLQWTFWRKVFRVL